MENQLQIFSNPEFGEVRTQVDEKGEPWFCAKDVCDALGYLKARNAIAQHVDEDDALKQGLIDSMGRKQQTTFINESGLYALILSSKLESAKRFKHWVTSEVLPSIRKRGAFFSNDALERAVREPDFLIKLASAIKHERQQKEMYAQKCTEQGETIKQLEKQSAYVDYVLQSPGLLNINQIAQDYGISAQCLNSLLRQHLIQYKSNNQWILYAKYKDKGYVHSTTHILDNGIVVMHTQWTQKGRLFLYEQLKSWGFYPIMEQQDMIKRTDLFSMDYGR
ncbi:Prophage antirepressor [Bacteroides xylanisolvens]|uniref:Prophage antirepressor n=1 Tax=Bacteroides xylanisolvens TaxID=371601 RepID=A0A1H4GDN4_9BACE|nr:phage antirepressor [Bacteroides xylanisolvens]SEB07719.1 Prophage antirepressor [Bacteroides xylanisolvens]